jgi:hypothetical protein
MDEPPEQVARSAANSVSMCESRSTQLLNFFLREIDDEERGGFPRLSRIPDSQVAAQLATYRSLNSDER